MEEYKKALGDDYTPFINMININNNDNQPRPRPEQQQQMTLPPENARATADIMADIPLRNNSHNSNYDIGHQHYILEEMKEKEERKHQEGEWGHPHRHQQRQYNHHCHLIPQLRQRQDDDIDQRQASLSRLSSPSSTSSLCSHQSLTSCCHTATSTTFCISHVQQSTSASTSCQWPQGQLQTSVTPLELLEECLHHHQHRHIHCSVLQSLSSTSERSQVGLHRPLQQWVPLPRSARQDTADQHWSIAQRGLPEPLPAHPSTSAGHRRDQLQDHIDSTSWDKRQDWGQLEA